jgi:hypothetical protein
MLPFCFHFSQYFRHNDAPVYNVISYYTPSATDGIGFAIRVAAFFCDETIPSFRLRVPDYLLSLSAYLTQRTTNLITYRAFFRRSNSAFNSAFAPVDRSQNERVLCFAPDRRACGEA